MLKLADDLPALMEDEDLFCHCLQETLNFERELRQNCSYPSSQPSVLGEECCHLLIKLARQMTKCP